MSPAQTCLPFDAAMHEVGRLDRDRPFDSAVPDAGGLDHDKPFDSSTGWTSEPAMALQVAPPLAESAAPPALPAPPALVFVRHPRAKRYLLRVTPDGTVRVTIPRWGSKREAAAFAERERAWIEQQQRRFEAQRLVRAEEERRGERPSPVEMRALREQAKRELPPRLLELAAQHALTVTRISIRNQRWRWGSCSRSGHVCLNWRLVQMPAMVRDYVLIHELMHLKRMDHSPAFWKLVAAACPAYKKARAWLRSQGAR